MGYFALSVDDTPLAQIRAAQQNLRLFKHATKDVPMSYLIDFASQYLEDAEKTLSDGPVLVSIGQVVQR